MTALFDLKDHGVTVAEIHRNLPPSALYEHAFRYEKDACQLKGAMTLIIYERLRTLVSPTHSPPRHAARLLRPYRLRGDSLSRSLRRLRFPHWRGWLAQWRCFQRKCNRNTLTTSWPEWRFC